MIALRQFANGKGRGEDSCLTALAMLDEPQEEAAALQMLSLQTILMNYSEKDPSLQSTKKSFIGKDLQFELLNGL